MKISPYNSDVISYANKEASKKSVLGTLYSTGIHGRIAIL